MSALRGVAAAAAAKLRAAAAARTTAPGRAAVRGRSFCDANPKEPEGLFKKGADVEGVNHGKKANSDPKTEFKKEKSDEQSGVKKDNLLSKAEFKKEKSDEQSGVKKENFSSKCLTESELKFVLYEKELAGLKNAHEFQSKVNWWSLSLVGTIVCSIPVGLYKVHEMGDKQKVWESKYKALKAHVRQIELANKGDTNKAETEETQDMEEEEEEIDNKTSWLEWVLSLVGMGKDGKVNWKCPK